MNNNENSVNSNENSVNNNENGVNSNEAAFEALEHLVTSTWQRIQYTHQRVEQVTHQLRLQRGRLVLLHMREHNLFERCLRQQEAIRRSYAKKRNEEEYAD